MTLSMETTLNILEYQGVNQLQLYFNLFIFQFDDIHVKYS